MEHLNGLALEDLVRFFRMLISVGVTVKMVHAVAGNRRVARDVATFWASRINHEVLTPEHETTDPNSANGQLIEKNKRVMNTVRKNVKDADRAIVAGVAPGLFSDETPLDYTGLLKGLAPIRHEKVLPKHHRPQNFEEFFLFRLQDPGNGLTHHDIARLYGRGYVWSQLWSRAFGYKRHTFK